MGRDVQWPGARLFMCVLISGWRHGTASLLFWDLCVVLFVWVLAPQAQQFMNLCQARHPWKAGLPWNASLSWAVLPTHRATATVLTSDLFRRQICYLDLDCRPCAFFNGIKLVISGIFGRTLHSRSPAKVWLKRAKMELASNRNRAAESASL